VKTGFFCVSSANVYYQRFVHFFWTFLGYNLTKKDIELIGDITMKQQYTFCDLITTELDLEEYDNQLCHNILSTIEFLYKYPNDILFTQLKKLINDSKTLHRTVNLTVVAINKLDLGAHWDIEDKTIVIEMPSATLDVENIFIFTKRIFFELCNSVNSFFADVIAYEQIRLLNINDPGSYAKTIELAEYGTCKHYEEIEKSTRRDLITLIAMLKSNQQYNQSILDHNIMVKALMEYREEYADSFEEHWKHCNDRASSGNRELSHSDVYRKSCSQLKEQLSVITVSQIYTYLEQENHLDDDEIALNAIFKEIIANLKVGAFELATAKLKYIDTLKEAALRDENKKLDYYALYQIIMGNGKKINMEQLSYFFEISSIIVDLANGKLELTRMSKEERNLIELAFEIMDFFNEPHSNLSEVFAVIEKQYMPKLQEIKDRNPELAEKYRNSLYAINSAILEVPFAEIIQVYREQGFEKDKNITALMNQAKEAGKQDTTYQSLKLGPA